MTSSLQCCKCIYSSRGDRTRWQLDWRRKTQFYFAVVFCLQVVAPNRDTEATHGLPFYFLFLQKQAKNRSLDDLTKSTSRGGATGDAETLLACLSLSSGPLLLLRHASIFFFCAGISGEITAGVCRCPPTIRPPPTLSPGPITCKDSVFRAHYFLLSSHTLSKARLSLLTL